MSAPGLPNPLPPPENRAAVLNGVAIGLLVPAMLTLAARLWVRAFTTKNVGIDDWLMLISALFLVPDQVISIVFTNYGVSQHIFYLAPTDALEALKLNTITQPFNIVGFFFVKASIVALLIRLKLPKSFKIILSITVGWLLAITLAGIIIAFAQCQPFEKNWNVTMPGNCWPRDAFQDAAYILQGLTIVTDLCYIIMPIIFFWNVQISSSLKVGILGIISLGAVTPPVVGIAPHGTSSAPVNDNMLIKRCVLAPIEDTSTPTIRDISTGSTHLIS